MLASSTAEQTDADTYRMSTDTTAVPPRHDGALAKIRAAEPRMRVKSAVPSAWPHVAHYEDWLGLGVQSPADALE